jgi:hypothetical protein
MPGADTAFQQIPAHSKNYNAVHSYSDLRVLSRLNSSPVSRPTPGTCPLCREALNRHWRSCCVTAHVSSDAPAPCRDHL